MGDQLVTDSMRQRLRSRIGRTATDETVDAWFEVGPTVWVLRHAGSLTQAGLTAEDAQKLYRRLGPKVSEHVSSLIDAGRYADLDTRHIHLWAASGLLKPEVSSSRARPNVTRWVQQARVFIRACGGDQQLAALAAAAGFSVDETKTMVDDGTADEDSLRMLVALRDNSVVSDSE